MEECFYNNIIPYLDDKMILNISLLSKNEILKKNRKTVLKRNSSKKMMRFLLNYFSCFDIRAFIDYEVTNTEEMFELLKMVSDSLLCNNNFITYNNLFSYSKIKNTGKVIQYKHVNTNVYKLIQQNSLCYDNEIKYYSIVSSIYRLSMRSTYFLIKDFPYAKALIY